MSRMCGVASIWSAACTCCYSVALAGGGVRGGRIIGSSDWIAHYPKERPVPIAGLAATIFHALGVDLRAHLYDIQGQLRMICDGIRCVSFSDPADSAHRTWCQEGSAPRGRGSRS